jgi:hypothetical protein
VQIGGEPISTGANASKETAEDVLDDEVKTVLNVVESHSLQQVTHRSGGVCWRRLVLGAPCSVGELMPPPPR